MTARDRAPHVALELGLAAGVLAAGVLAAVFFLLSMGLCA